MKITAAAFLAIGEEADVENCQPAHNLIRSTKLHLSTEPAFLPNACYSQFFLSASFSSSKLLNHSRPLSPSP